jgi:HEAT repeat protein
VPHLLQLVGRQRRPVAEHSVTLALVRIGAAGVPALTAALEGSGPRVAAVAAHVLGWLGDHTAVPSLSRAAACDDERVAVAAIEALGRMDSPAAEPSLRSRLSAGEEPQVRLAATRALGRLGHPSSVDVLAGLLGEEHEVSRAAAVSLGRLGTAGRDALEASAGTVPEAREALGRDGLALAGAVGSTRGG